MDRPERATTSIENYRGWAADEDVHRLTGRKDKANTVFVNALVSSRIDARPEHSVIDVGCGDGSLLASLPCRVRIGVSPTEEERARLAAERAGVEFRAGLAQKIPAEDASADRVICNGVLSLLPSVSVAGEALAELARIARPGALVYVGEMVCRNAEARPKALGSAPLGAWLYRTLRFDRDYAEFHRKDYVRAIDGKMLAVERPETLRLAAAAGLERLWDAPHPYYARPERLISPSRRNYLFRKSPA